MFVWNASSMSSTFAILRTDCTVRFSRLSSSFSSFFSGHRGPGHPPRHEPVRLDRGVRQPHWYRVSRVERALGGLQGQRQHQRRLLHRVVQPSPGIKDRNPGCSWSLCSDILTKSFTIVEPWDLPTEMFSVIPRNVDRNIVKLRSCERLGRE